MTTKNASPRALAELALDRLRSGGYIDNAHAAALAEGRAIHRGAIEEILAIGESMDLKAFVLRNGIDRISTYDDLEAKVAQLVAQVNGLPRKAAFEMVTGWIRHSRMAKAIEASAEFYVALSSTMDEIGEDTVTEELLTNDNFRDSLGQNAAYNRALRLPYHQFTARRTGDLTDERTMFGRITEVRPDTKGRHAEAIRGSDYQQAVMVMIIADRLAEGTKAHVGVDIFNLNPITYTDLPFEKALRYTSSIPAQLHNWFRRGLTDTLIVTDNDQNVFLRDPERLRGIVNIVLAQGENDPLFIAYESAIAVTQRLNSTESDRKAVLVALHALQKKLYTVVEITFTEANQELHPKVETVARNIGWFVLTPGDGSKVAPKHWRKMHSLKDSEEHLDEGNAPSLASDITSLKEIARAEDIDLTSEKREITEQLRTELAAQPRMDLDNIANAVLAAYGKTDHMTHDGNVTWYITTVLFRTSEKFAKDTHYDGGRRKYAAVHELANFIRSFKAN